jgi:choline monooxygenase
VTGNRIARGPLTEGGSARTILPGSAYTDQDWFSAELDAVYHRGWVWAGYSHWVPEPGSVRPITAAGQPLLLTRDADGTLHVFHNLCRHRGLLLTEDTPDCPLRRLRCPYHSWTFGLDGELCAAPFWDRTRQGRPSEEERRALGLLPVRHAEWAGMVLVRLDGDVVGADRADGSPDGGTDDLLAALQERWQGTDLTRLHPAGERRYEIRANWKLVVENFLDFYHLPFIHPQVGPASISLDVDDVVLSPDLLGGCYPRGRAAKPSKTDGTEDLPLLGEVPERALSRQDLFCVFPNALVFLEADWFQVIGLEPLAPDLTVEHFAVLVHDTAAGPRYAGAREKVFQVLTEVNDQDVPILENLQRARRSPAADRTRLLPAWDQITARFQQRVADAVRRGPDQPSRAQASGLGCDG